MSEKRDQKIESLRAWGEQLTSIDPNAHRKPSWLRQFATPLALVTLVGGGGVAIAQTVVGGDQPNDQQPKVVSKDGVVRGDGEVSQRGDTVRVGGSVEKVPRGGVIDYDGFASIPADAPPPDPVQVAMCREELAKRPAGSESCEITIAVNAGQLKPGVYETKTEFEAEISKSTAVAEAKAAEPKYWPYYLKEDLDRCKKLSAATEPLPEDCAYPLENEEKVLRGVAQLRKAGIGPNDAPRR